MAGGIEVDVTELRELADKMAAFPKQSNQAMARALNDGIKRVQTDIVKETQQEYTVKGPQIKKTMTVKRATASKLIASVNSNDKRIKLGSFKFTYARNKQRSPVKVQIKKGGAKLSTSKPAMFAGQSRATGRKEVFRRTEGGAYKIEYPFTLSIPQMIANPDVYKRIANDAHPYVAQRMEHHLNYYISKYLSK